MKKRSTAILLGIVLATITTFSSFCDSSKQQVLAKTSVQTISGTAVEENTAQAVDMNKLLNMDELYGWATVPGEGLQGVTGGGNAEPVVVTTLAELETVSQDDIPRVIIISGTIKCDGAAIVVGSNKTIVGIDENAKVHGGFFIENENNIIISNLNVQGVWPNGAPDDCFAIKGCHHLWLNHLNIWNSTDGNLDITVGSDYVTVSWCKFWYSPEATTHTHRLSCLIGSGAGDHDDTDKGKLRVTYHHNWFADLLMERMPRVMYGRVHVYNNYYTCENNSYCIGADSYGSVLIENNYFKNVNNPHEFCHTPGLPAAITARGNEYDNTTGRKTTGQHHANSSVETFETTLYDYYLHDAKDVPELIQAYAGPLNVGDLSALPDEMANGALVEGVEEAGDIVMPSVSPLPTLKPANTVNDNPIIYEEETDTYIYGGQNRNGSNAYYTIDNPYKGYDFSEEPKFKRGYPVWKKGATISYWVKVPKGAKDAAILNFNLENHRQMERNDEVKYRMCQNYSDTDETYSMGNQSIYVDASGNEYTVLAGYGENVCYNPNYPEEGCYYTNSGGGAIYAYALGTDSEDSSNWTYLNYIGDGLYKNYGKRFDEEGGHTSLIKEAGISGSFSLYASGTMGYRQDNWLGRQMNPYLDSYGDVVDIQQYNQFCYWGNGGYKTLDEDYIVPTMEEKGQWHFVVVVIQNDWVQFYMDGKEMTIDYLCWWDQPINVNTGSKSFNLGYGHKMVYRSNMLNSKEDSVGMTILDFISNEETVLTVGGMGAGASRLGQSNIGTPNGTEVKDLQFYYEPIAAECIKEDRIVEDPDVEEPSEKPIVPESSSQPTEPKPTQSPADNSELGDVDGNKAVELADAQLALKAALKIIVFETEQVATADVDSDGVVELQDAQMILKKALKIIDNFG